MKLRLRWIAVAALALLAACARPLQRFEADGFLVGIGPFHTHFEVNAPPHREGTTWTMTVDGVELTRVAGPEAGQEPGWRAGGNQKVRI